MLNAFGEAWKKRQTFDLEKVLRYCLSTLKSSKFYSGELRIENDHWRADSDWVVGSIANLLADGLQNDQHAFGVELLSFAKEIVEIIVGNLERVDDLQERNMDYPTYSLNSTSGKSLTALLNYSLYTARKIYKEEDKEKWERGIKSLFEETLQKGIIDGYILEGMYFENFCFLDYNWMITQVEKNYHIGDREWLAFMRGFAFCRPTYNKELYTMMYPHFERAIESRIELKDSMRGGLVYHLMAFYFLQYETLSSKKLLYKFVHLASPNDVAALINLIAQQKYHPRTLSELKQQEFQQIIIDLWKFLLDKYESSQIEEEKKNIPILSRWVVFVHELNEEYTSLILRSCKHIIDTYLNRELLKHLVAIKTNGDPITNSTFIGKILLSLNFGSYVSSDEQDSIKDLILFLFTNGGNQMAEAFCNNIAAVHQQYFLREIYEASKK